MGAVRAKSCKIKFFPGGPIYGKKNAIALFDRPNKTVPQKLSCDMGAFNISFHYRQGRGAIFHGARAFPNYLSQYQIGPVQTRNGLHSGLELSKAPGFSNSEF